MKMKVLGSRIRECRVRLGLTQLELARRLNTDQKQISKYENGHQDPSAGVLGILAVELNTSADYLLGLTDSPDRPVRSERDLSEREREIIRALRDRGLEGMVKAYMEGVGQ